MPQLGPLTRRRGMMREHMATKTKTRFDWSDPFLLDQQLTSEERMIRDSARAYCKDQLAPRVLEMFRKEQADPSIFRELGALDMLGIVIPEEYGGAGLGYVAYGLVARELERIDSGFRSMMSVQGSLVMVPINELGTEAQKKKFLPKLDRRVHWLLRLDRAQRRLRPRQHDDARSEGGWRLPADGHEVVDQQ